MKSAPRFTRIPRHLHPALAAFLVLFGIIGGGGILYIFNNAWPIDYEANPELAEVHSDYLRRYAEFSMQVHEEFSKEEPEPSRYLSGYTSAEEVGREVVRAYRSAIQEKFLNPQGYADFALIQHYLGNDYTMPAAQIVGKYEQAVARLTRGELLSPELKAFVRNYAANSKDWWSAYLAELAGVPAGDDSGALRFQRFARSQQIGTGIYALLGLSLIFLIPATLALFRPARNQHRIIQTWHPLLGVSATLWALVFGILAMLPLSFLPFYDNGFDLLLYFVFAGMPCLILGISFLPKWSSFTRVMGLGIRELFAFRTFQMVMGLYAIHALWMLAYYFIQSLGGTVDTRDFLTDGLIDADFPTLLTELVVVSIFAPVFEEITFRGFLFNSLRSRLNPVIAAMLSSLLFGVLHGYSAMGNFEIMIFGMLMCWVYAKTGSLWPGIIFHSLLNCQITLNIWYTFSQNPQIPGLTP